MGGMRTGKAVTQEEARSLRGDGNAASTRLRVAYFSPTIKMFPSSSFPPLQNSPIPVVSIRTRFGTLPPATHPDPAPSPGGIGCSLHSEIAALQHLRPPASSGDFSACVFPRRAVPWNRVVSRVRLRGPGVAIYEPAAVADLRSLRLPQLIMTSGKYGRGRRGRPRDDLVISNAQTGEGILSGFW
nr:unnamed protein product [Digitaria exilis]